MHIPVLLNEVIDLLEPRPGKFFADGTLGEGGHATEIIKKIAPDGYFLGTELNEDSFVTGGKKATESARQAGAPKERVVLVRANYAAIPEILKERKLPRLDGLLLDIGISSFELERSGRGFSFRKDESLDMRHSLETETTAYDILNNLNQKDLERIFREFGEEKKSRRIAEAIVEKRKQKKISTTFELAQTIMSVIPEKGGMKTVTRIFQAVRIFVNDELENLRKTMDALPGIMASGGRVAVVSFHSLEDRIVKNRFRELKAAGLAEIVTKRPVTPGEEEITRNPKSRSAKLRVLKMI